MSNKKSRHHKSLPDFKTMCVKSDERRKHNSESGYVKAMVDNYEKILTDNMNSEDSVYNNNCDRPFEKQSVKNKIDSFNTLINKERNDIRIKRTSSYRSAVKSYCQISISKNETEPTISSNNNCSDDKNMLNALKLVRNHDNVNKNQLSTNKQSLSRFYIDNSTSDGDSFYEQKFDVAVSPATPKSEIGNFSQFCSIQPKENPKESTENEDETKHQKTFLNINREYSNNSNSQSIDERRADKNNMEECPSKTTQKCGASTGNLIEKKFLRLNSEERRKLLEKEFKASKKMDHQNYVERRRQQIQQRINAELEMEVNKRIDIKSRKNVRNLEEPMVKAKTEQNTICKNQKQEELQMSSINSSELPNILLREDRYQLGLKKSGSEVSVNQKKQTVINDLENKNNNKRVQIGTEKYVVKSSNLPTTSKAEYVDIKEKSKSEPPKDKNEIPKDKSEPPKDKSEPPKDKSESPKDKSEPSKDKRKSGDILKVVQRRKSENSDNNWVNRKAQVYEKLIYDNEKGYARSDIMIGEKCILQNRVRARSLPRKKSKNPLNRLNSDDSSRSETSLNAEDHTEGTGRVEEEIGDHTEEIGNHTEAIGYHTEEIGYQTEEIGSVEEKIGKNGCEYRHKMVGDANPRKLEKTRRSVESQDDISCNYDSLKKTYKKLDDFNKNLPQKKIVRQYYVNEKPKVEAGRIRNGRNQKNMDDTQVNKHFQSQIIPENLKDSLENLGISLKGNNYIYHGEVDGIKSKEDIIKLVETVGSSPVGPQSKTDSESSETSKTQRQRIYKKHSEDKPNKKLRITHKIDSKKKDEEEKKGLEQILLDLNNDDVGDKEVVVYHLDAIIKEKSPDESCVVLHPSEGQCDSAYYSGNQLEHFNNEYDVNYVIIIDDNVEDSQPTDDTQKSDESQQNESETITTPSSCPIVPRRKSQLIDKTLEDNSEALNFGYDNSNSTVIEASNYKLIIENLDETKSSECSNRTNSDEIKKYRISRILLDKDSNPIIKTESIANNLNDLGTDDVGRHFEKLNKNNIWLDDYESISDSDSVFEESSQYKITKKMNLIMQEILNTEENYIHKLQIIITEYLPEMQKVSVPNGLLGKENVIFGNIVELHAELMKFLPKLKKCKDVQDIAELFLLQKHLFELYIQYSRNKINSQKELSIYGDFFSKKQLELGDPLNLQSYLLEPTQRLCRYLLLLKRLLQECKDEKYPCTLLEQAIQYVDSEINRGNDIVALDQVRGRLDINVYEQGRVILRNNFRIWTVNRKNSFDAMVFLLKKCILITKIQIKNNEEIYQYVDAIAINELGYTHLDYENHEFKIWFRHRDMKIYTLIADDENVKEKWCEIIYRELWKQFEESKRRMKNSPPKKTKDSQYSTKAKSQYIERPRKENGSTHSLVIKQRKPSTRWHV